MLDSLEKLKEELHRAHQALASAEQRCAHDFAMQQSKTKELLDTCSKIESAYQEWLAALDVVDDLILLYDTDFRILRCNQAYKRRAGLPIDKIIGQIYYDIFPKSEGPIRFGSKSSAVPETKESGLVTVGGTIYRSRVFPVKDKHGKRPYIIHSFVDITEQRASQDRLSASHDLLESIVENVPSHIYWKDKSLHYLGGNSKFAREIGIETPQRLMGLSDLELPEGVLNPCSEERERRVMDSGTPEIGYEVNHVAADGRAVWLRCSTIPLFSAEHDVFGVLNLYDDITERRENLERLKLFRTLMDHSHDAIEVIDPVTTRFYDVNNAECQTLGYTREEMLTMSVSDIDPSFTPEMFKSLHVKLSETGSARFEGVHRRKDGSTFPVEISAQIVELDKPYAVNIVRDITERKLAEEQTRLTARVFTHAREGIMITAADGAIVDVNESFTRITGYERNDVLGQNPRLLSSGLQGPAFYKELWKELIEQGYWFGEIWNRRKNGEVYAEMLTISAIRDDQGEIRNFISLFSDITATKKYEQQLEHVAHYDALTNLPNRVLLADRLHQGMVHVQRHGQSLAVVYLDLDGFKAVNDQYGHNVGDQLLMAVARNMKATLREEDTLARIGGDEFIIILLDLADVNSSVGSLERLLAAAAQPVHVGEYELKVSASLGITFYPQPSSDDVDADQLIRQADQAMYMAKQAGKNRYHIFDNVLDHSVRIHYENVERMRQALIQREFVLYYQPKVNMRTGTIIGVEALIRWQHPERGLLSPAAFLPSIEEQVLSIELGEWVINTALEQSTRWKAQGLNVPVSVNVGARQLLQEGFVARLQSILHSHSDFEPGDLTIEILETSALEDLGRASLAMESCHKLGVQFALDDFGTGYSSLSYLKKLAVAEIKIDQTFVCDMLDDPDDLSILEGVIGLSRAFRRNVIAEGVETVAHGEMLLRMGCDLGQGYGIARPMPGETFTAWAASWRPESSWIGLPAIRRIDEPLLFAGVDHRAWIIALTKFLKDEEQFPPPLDHRHCKFGTWLGADGQSRYGKSSTFQTIVELHHKVHLLAEELLVLSAERGKAVAMEQLESLFSLRDNLLNQLNLLIHEASVE